MANVSAKWLESHAWFIAMPINSFVNKAHKQSFVNNAIVVNSVYVTPINSSNADIAKFYYAAERNGHQYKRYTLNPSKV